MFSCSKTLSRFLLTVLIAASSVGITNAEGDGPLMPGDYGYSGPLNPVEPSPPAAANNRMPIELGNAETFAILSQTGITDVYPSNVTGDVGTSPITGAALLLSCGEVSGNVYSVNAAGPMPCTTTDAPFLTAAVGDMGFAYNDAAGRVSPDVTELAAGAIGGLTLEPGLYKWSSTVLIDQDLKLDAQGNPDAVWIFQIAGTLTQASYKQVILEGGAQAKNVFWQVAGAVTIGTYAHFEGIVLAKTMIAVNTGASVNGRLLAQTAVTLQMSTITQPSEVTQPSDSTAPLPLCVNPVEPSSPVAASNRQPIELGYAETFAILSQTGITNVYSSNVTGDVGTSPITGAALLLSCGEVSGNVYSVNAAGPMPCTTTDAPFLTAAVGDMGFAYNDAAGRVSPDVTELAAGAIGGLTLEPGLYKWSSTVLIDQDLKLDAQGNPDAVWIFQIAGTLTQASYKQVILEGGAQAKNVFWQVAGAVTIGTYAHFEGIVLAKTMIAVNTGASVNGRLLAQTAVTLQMNTINQPSEVTPPSDFTGPLPSCLDLIDQEPSVNLLLN
jgi:cytoskeletal protein CcmA (bactofilin family)